MLSPYPHACNRARADSKSPSGHDCRPNDLLDVLGLEGCRGEHLVQVQRRFNIRGPGSILVVPSKVSDCELVMTLMLKRWRAGGFQDVFARREESASCAVDRLTEVFDVIDELRGIVGNNGHNLVDL